MTCTTTVWTLGTFTRILGKNFVKATVFFYIYIKKLLKEKLHSVEVTEIHPQAFLQKSRESDSFTR